MKTFKYNKAYTTVDVIESLLHSSGFPIVVSEEVYNEFDIGDKVLFVNTRLNHQNLYGTIRRKHQQPSSIYINNVDEREYVFTATFDARVELVLD